MTDLRRSSEAEIQRAVVQHLLWRAAPGVAWFATPNGGIRSKAEAAIMAGTGTKAGAPDLVFVRRGHFFGLEVKTINGRLSEAQLAMHDELQAAGAMVGTGHGLEDALEILDTWGLILPNNSGGR